MPPIPTVADVEKAKLNLDAWDAVTNGDENTTETMPDGGLVDTIAKAIASIKAFNFRGDWTDLTAYAVKDLVVDPDDSNGAVYVSVSNHVSGSGTFQDDYDSGNGPWRLYQGSRDIVVGNMVALKALTGLDDNQTVERLGYYSMAEIGTYGKYRYDASSVETANDGTVVELDSMPGRLYLLWEGDLNIKLMGCTGDGVTPEQVQLQKAIDLEVPLYAPFGSYLVTASLTYETYFKMRGDGYSHQGGDPRSRIVGDLTTPILHRKDIVVTSGVMIGTPAVTSASCFELSDIEIQNDDSVSGSCVQLWQVVGAYIHHCEFTFGWRGVEAANTFDVAVNENIFRSTWADTYSCLTDDYSEAIGLLLGNHGYAENNDFQGCGTAVRIYGLGTALLQARIEVCGKGIQVGTTFSEAYTAFGFASGLVGGSVDSIRMEACHDAVDIVSMSSARVANINSTSSVNGPDGNGYYGLTVRGADKTSVIENITMSGAYVRWAANYSASAADARYSNIVATNSLSNAASTGVTSLFNRGSTGHRNLINMPIYDKSAALTDAEDGVSSYFGKLLLGGICQPDLTRAPVYPNNLCGTLAVGSGATTASYTFMTAKSNGNAAFTVNPAEANHVGSTLAPATYYYACTNVGPRGETGVDISAANHGNYRTVAITGADKKATMTFANPDSRLRRRIYRGTELGVFDGYFDVPNTTTTFEDIGQAFDGEGVPPASGISIPTMAEKDTNYFINIQPTWATTWYVSSKLTTGFTITFGTAAPSDQTVGWLMYRP